MTISFEPISIVGGFTMADINAAKVLAGANGKLFFPAGTYDIAGLVADVPNQTWVFQKGAVMLRNATSATHGVSIPAGNSLEMVGGVLDMNRANNASDAYRGIDSVDGNFKWSGDWQLKACPGPGMSIHNGMLDLRDGKISDTKYMGIYWVALSIIAANEFRTAPHIERVTVDRRVGYGSSGGIIINGGSSAVTSREAVVRDCVVRLPYITSDAMRASYYDSVAIEINRCYYPSVEGNLVQGGRIAYSFATCACPCDVGNRSVAVSDYAHEHVGSEFGVVSGNTGTGMFLPGTSYGIVLSGACTGCSVTGNHSKMGYGVSVSNQSAVSSYPSIFVGNL